MKCTFVLLVVLLTTILIACVKPDDPSFISLKVSEIRMRTEKYPLDTAIYRFDYSVKNEIIIREGISKQSTRYVFDAQNRITEIQMKKLSGQLLFEVGLSYKSSTATMLITDYSVTHPYLEDSVIFYLGSNGLATHSIGYRGLYSLVKIDTTIYTWSDHDLVGMIQKHGEEKRSMTMAYDDSFNPLWVSELPITFYLNFSYDFFYACTKHNMVEAKLSSGEIIYSTASRKYNSENYLSSIVTDIQAEQGKFETQFEFIPK